jgi:hypothetical protein
MSAPRTGVRWGGRPKRSSEIERAATARFHSALVLARSSQVDVRSHRSPGEDARADRRASLVAREVF